MKKILGISLTFILLMFWGSVAVAKERIVQLNIPGCAG